MLRVQALEMEQDGAGLQRLKFRREGWSRWKWEGHDIHYVKAGASVHWLAQFAPALSSSLVFEPVCSSTCSSMGRGLHIGLSCNSSMRPLRHRTWHA